MKPTDKKLTQLVDGKYYWIKYSTTWEIASYQEQFKQFRFTNGSVCDIPNLKDVDPKPITRI